MDAQHNEAAIEPTGARPLLRRWREARHLSQLDLALDAEVSTSHISFLETGRAAPSREMLLTLSDVLALRERNFLLLAAGYAPVYRETSLDDPRMAQMRGWWSGSLRFSLSLPAASRRCICATSRASLGCGARPPIATSTRWCARGCCVSDSRDHARQIHRQSWQATAAARIVRVARGVVEGQQKCYVSGDEMKKTSAAKCTECEKRRVIAIVAHRGPLSKRRAVHPSQALRRYTPWCRWRDHGPRLASDLAAEDRAAYREIAIGGPERKSRLNSNSESPQA
jgi:transcriptional regulator with XRE-family HTH domain